MIFTRFYSELTKKFYDVYEEAEAAEHEYAAAMEAKKHEQDIMLESLAQLKTTYEEANTIAQEASKTSRKAYEELTKAVRAYFNKYGSVPKEYANLTFMTDLFSLGKFFS